MRYIIIYEDGTWVGVGEKIVTSGKKTGFYTGFKAAAAQIYKDLEDLQGRRHDFSVAKKGIGTKLVDFLLIKVGFFIKNRRTKV